MYVSYCINVAFASAWPEGVCSYENGVDLQRELAWGRAHAFESECVCARVHINKIEHTQTARSPVAFANFRTSA